MSLASAETLVEQRVAQLEQVSMILPECIIDSFTIELSQFGVMNCFAKCTI